MAATHAAAGIPIATASSDDRVRLSASRTVSAISHAASTITPAIAPRTIPCTTAGPIGRSMAGARSMLDDESGRFQRGRAFTRIAALEAARGLDRERARAAEHAPERPGAALALALELEEPAAAELVVRGIADDPRQRDEEPIAGRAHPASPSTPSSCDACPCSEPR